ncbi:4-hydroxyacetophenone monooxygenase [Ramaria rubella]|nr:4-hydroxyacetophenone monooxygenase [Ramaria rubella]
MAQPTKFNEILCIGAGLSGVCLGAQLKRKLNFTDIHFYDKNVSHSGTWQANQYPGCACDITAIFYSFSFEPNPDWTSRFPSSREIREYINGVVEKYHLRPLMTFQTECESATWDSDRQTWTVHLLNILTGEHYTHECRILFSAVGVLVTPKFPNISGQESFEGAIFHTAQWKNDVDLKDRDIIVIGNGYECSATQVVPEITHGTKTLTQFINTPQWLIEATNVEIGPRWKWAFRNIPLFMHLMRFIIFLRTENRWRVFVMNESGAHMRKQRMETSKEYILRAAPKKYHNILIPDYEIACKRRVNDVGQTYLKSLHEPHFHLTKDPIIEILPHGVRTATKTYPADVIVLATGFETGNGLGPVRIRGRNKEWLNDHWLKSGGPGAYNNTAVHGYPNLMLIYGPHSSTGYTSVIFAVENQVNYALKIIEPLINGYASEFEVKHEAENKYLESLREASSNRVWNTCQSWYVAGGRNSTLYPWSQIYLWWRSLYPRWSDWDYKVVVSNLNLITILMFSHSILVVIPAI